MENHRGPRCGADTPGCKQCIAHLLRAVADSTEMYGRAITFSCRRCGRRSWNWLDVFRISYLDGSPMLGGA